MVFFYKTFTTIYGFIANLLTTIPPHEGDFYYLALLKNKNVPSGYQIHGLWSNYADGNYPSYCKKVHFDMDKFKPIADELKTYWPSRDHKNEEFYAHEYKKHGSCLFSEMTELEYFQKTIELYHYVIKNDLYKPYIKGNQCLIPFDLEFHIKRIKGPQFL